MNLEGESITLTNTEEDLVVGRNGTHRLAGIQVWRSDDGYLFIDGIGVSGKVLRAGFTLGPLSAENFLRDIKKTFGG